MCKNYHLISNFFLFRKKTDSLLNHVFLEINLHLWRLNFHYLLQAVAYVETKHLANVSVGHLQMKSVPMRHVSSEQ